mmetsp:Transcript_2793/g.5897  ORF Transcript_2793/g.5897 Transcript_2793/m.5897 type:complete len:84 (+) Transcript_2793:85-336(+)
MELSATSITQGLVTFVFPGKKVGNTCIGFNQEVAKRAISGEGAPLFAFVTESAEGGLALRRMIRFRIVEQSSLAGHSFTFRIT